MLSFSTRAKQILFTILWVLQAASCFGIGGWGILPFVLAGFILLLLVLLWLFPRNDVLRRVVFGGFLLLSLAFLLMFVAWAVFFGGDNPLYCVVFACGLLILLASCWLINP